MRLIMWVLPLLMFATISPITPCLHSITANRQLVEATQPIVYVDPSNITDPTMTPSRNLTVELRVFNVTDLKGLDIRMSWNASLLNYTSHIVKIPVEVHPGGILHQPVIEVRNEVNGTGGTCIVAYASLLAPSFNGSGIVFEMTFEVLGFGECTLEIYNCDLSDSKGQPITPTVENGYFNNLYYDVAILSVLPSPSNPYIGETINITVITLNNGTVREEDFNVTTFYGDTAISTEMVSALPPDTEATLVFRWNTTGVTPGDYIISANATAVEREAIMSNNRFEDGVVTLAIEPIHDIAVTSLISPKTVVFEGYCLCINVTLENQGNFDETVNVTLYANNVAIKQMQLYIGRGSTVDVAFSWNTTDATEYEDYYLNATADQVTGENETEDNGLMYEGLKVAHPGDFDVDGDVDIYDIVSAAYTYDSNKGDLTYHADFDVDCNGMIDIYDIVIITFHYDYERP